MHDWVAARQGKIGIGVQVFALPSDPEPTKHVLEAGLLAEQLGFDAFFIGDHPGYATEPFVHLAAIAARTTRIGLGSVVNCVYHRHPAHLARLAGDLDHISQGRFVLGLGIGWNEREFKQLGLAFPSVRVRQEALDEALEIINGIFGPEPFKVQGKHWWTEGGHYQVPTPQRPRPPIVIAGSGEKTTLRQVARFADACNFGPGRNTGAVRGDEGIQYKLDVLRRHCAEIGRPYDDILRTHFTSWVMVAPTEENARAKLRGYYPNGLNEEQEITRIVGSPEQVTAYYQEIVDAGMQYLVVQVLDATDHETLHLLATDVMPNLRPRS
ncbi:MAG: LLM class flavin-dependent oxidoreductase [Thermomicrobiales bacterium]|nr:LLM class flavin-dependent oxidoreductase [Thermomicrobiales bacterium]